MNPARAAVIAGAFLLVGVAFYVLGRVCRPTEDWSEQHVNLSKVPNEFRNSFHGLSLRTPTGGEWELIWEPAKFRLPQDLASSMNKVLEINRMEQEGEPNRARTGMDLFVERLGEVPAEHVVRSFELRDKRWNFREVSKEGFTVAGRAGSVRVGAWTVGRRKLRSVIYSVERRGKLYVFVGVTEAEVLEGVRPVFDQIVSQARIE